MDEENCKNLCVAVIKLAMIDYIEGLKLTKKNKAVHHYVPDCEKFFMSEWFDFYKLGIDVDGQSMIRMLKEKAR